MSPDYRIKNEQVISDDWGKLMKVTYELPGRNGEIQEKKAEVYHKGDAVAVLLYNRDRGTVVLTRQFRIAAAYKDQDGAMLTEVCAGLIEDGLSPEETVRKEIAEETGYRLTDITPVMKLFMSPGVFTEMLHLYVAPYTPADKQGSGGGLEAEGEQIELIELPYSEAMDKVASGAINDAKTVVLLQYAGLAKLLG